MSAEQCGGCKFWLCLTDDDEVTYTRGSCRRFPPVIDPLAVHEEMRYSDREGDAATDIDCSEPDMWIQPRTYRTVWCGEFKRRAKA